MSDHETTQTLEEEAWGTTLTLPIALEELKELATRRGYESVVDYIVALIDADDEALWDGQFTNSEDKLEHLADQAWAEHNAGLTEDFDPDDDAHVL